MKFEKEILEKLIFVEKKSYIEIGKLYDVSDTYIKKISRKLGIILPVRAKFSSTFSPHNKGSKTINYCKNCNIECSKYKIQSFCGKKCEGEYKSKLKYIDFLNNNDNYCYSTYTVRTIKPHILKEQNNKCAICNCDNNWNDKNLIFIIDHIDGNASNNKRENLRLICPNCDSQLDTYKSKNKNSARKERYLKNYK